MDSLTTGVPLNGKEDWKAILEVANHELLHRESKFVEPNFYFELKFILQLISIIKFDEENKLVFALKSRLKMMTLAFRMGWKAVYKQFDIDHKTQGETRHNIEKVFSEELDSDIELINYKVGYTQRPYTYGYSKPKIVNRNQRNNNVNNKSNFTCYNCGKQGHFARDCFSAAPRQQQQRRQNNMACYGCGKVGHLIADCYSAKRQTGGAGPSRGNYSKKKNYSKSKSKNNFNINKKPFEKKRYAESDPYDSGDESGSEVLNHSSHHQAPIYVPAVQMQYPVQMQWQPQQQQYLPPPQNQYMTAMNHQRPFLNQQQGYQQ